MLRPDLTETLGRERFLREIQLAAGLDDPHILPLCDSGEANGFLYFVMPVMAGQTLRDRLAAGPPPSIDEALRSAVDAVRVGHDIKISGAVSMDDEGKPTRGRRSRAADEERLLGPREGAEAFGLHL